MAAEVAQPMLQNPFQLQHDISGTRALPPMRSMMGKQVDSRKSSAPAASFGSGHGENKSFLSSGHTNIEFRGKDSPGPIYAVRSSFDKQVETTKSSSASVRLDTTDTRIKSMARNDGTPGPGTYTARPAIGVQPLSTNVSGPSCSLSPKAKNHKTFLTLAHCQRELLGTHGADPGTYHPGSSLGHQSLSTRQTGLAFSWGASREERGRGVFGNSKVSPAVGSYEALPSIGKQPLSTFKTLPACSFARGSSREQEHKRFMSPEHARMKQGRTSGDHSFDHQTEKVLSTFGKQVLSNRPNSTPASFGSTGSRGTFLKGPNTPGPGAYGV